MANNVKMGIVNIQKVLEKTKEGKRVHTQLKKSFDAKDKTLKSEENRLKKKRDDYAKKASLLSQKARMTEEKNLQKSFLELQQKMMQYQKSISAQEAKFKKPILEKIKKIVDQVSKSENVDFTVEVSASPVVYVKNKIELTDKVIKEYDKKHK